MNANEILKIVRGLRVAMSLADAVPTEAHKHEGDLKWFGEVVNVHGGYDAIRDALEAARAAAVATDPVGILLKLCDQLETMKHLMVLHPSGGQNYPYLDRDNVMAYVEQARAALSKSDTNLSEDERAEWSFKQWWAHVGAWETPEGFISFGSPMAVRAMLIQFGRMVEARAALRQPGALPDEAGKFQMGDTVRKTKGSQWSGEVVGTYSTSLTPEGYAVESSTERGSVQIYPAAALELVAAKQAGKEA